MTGFFVTLPIFGVRGRAGPGCGRRVGQCREKCAPDPAQASRSNSLGQLALAARSRADLLSGGPSAPSSLRIATNSSSGARSGGVWRFLRRRARVAKNAVAAPATRPVPALAATVAFG